MKRRQWRINKKKKQRAKQKVLNASNKFVSTNTPPISPSDEDLLAAPLQPSTNVEAAFKRGRKKKKNSQSKMYCELRDAKYKLKKAVASVEKYRKRCFRL